MTAIRRPAARWGCPDLGRFALAVGGGVRGFHLNGGMGEAAGRALQSRVQAEKDASRHEERLKRLYPVPLAPEEVKERLGVSLYDARGVSRPVHSSALRVESNECDEEDEE